MVKKRKNAVRLAFDFFLLFVDLHRIFCFVRFIGQTAQLLKFIARSERAFPGFRLFRLRDVDCRSACLPIKVCARNKVFREN
jgi:hypothetical protein